MAVAIDKISTMTLPDYAGLGAAIEGLTAKQAALVLSTRNLSELELEEVIIQNKLLEKYGAENLIKAGLISANSTLLASEKALTAEELEDLLVRKGVAEVEAKRLIQKNLQIIANGEETASVVMLNKALLDEAVEKGILTKEKAAEILSTLGVVAADNLEIGSKTSLLAVTGKLIVANAELIATTAGIVAIAAVWYKTSKAIDEARQRAQELGEEFKNSKSEIDDYKNKIEELHEIINDSNSSIEDVTNARKTLMSIQDEMIDKFGTEKSVIDDVTDAINGQIEALDRLTQAKWQEVKNDFNNKGDFWNNFGNWLQGGTDNIERMLKEYGEQTISFKWADYVDINKLTDEMVAELENIGIDIKVSTDNLQGVRDFDSLTESISNTKGAMLSFSGNAEEIYNQILSLQNLIGNDDSLDKLYDRLESTANSYKDLKDQYKEFYNQYILYEKILTDGSNYADVFKDITDAYEKYSDAFASGDKDKIKEATEKYASTISDAMATALTNGDSDVADYFENMYPALQSVVSDWKFNVAFDANTDDLQNTVQSVLDDLKDESGRQLTTEEILGLGEKDSRYRDLISIAHEYKMEIQELIPLLRELGLVSDMDYQGLVALFGQENIDSLTPEDIEIAYTINNVGNMTFDELVADIQRVKETANSVSFDFTTYEEQIDNIQSSISTLRDALSSLNTGSLTENSVLDLLQKFPELIPYVDMTADGFGNLAAGLNELINAQPTELINSLYELREAVNTEEERQQIDLLINSLQTLSTYGDTGIEAYATAIGTTWDTTSDVIDGVITQFENLAKVQEVVSDGLTMSATTAAELAKIYPEILTNAEIAANGQITLNEEVVNSILEGETAAIDAQIAQLEADKAVLTAKKEFAEAQLNMVKQVGEAEGNISLESAQYRINVANEVLKKAIQADEDEAEAYAEAIKVMSMNTEDFNVYVANVATDIASNIDNASVSMADSVARNTTNMQNSFQALKNKVTDVAKAIAAAWNGQIAGSDDIYSTSGGVGKGSISTNATRKDLNTYDFSWDPAELSLDQFTSQLELDIQGYQDAISNIDAQIDILKNLRYTFDDKDYSNKLKELENAKDKINNALKDSGSSSKDTYEELFDFFDRRVKVLDDALSLLKTNLDNVTGSFAKNNLIDAELGLTEEKFKNYSDALSMYTEKANEALSKLPSDIAQQIRDGAVAITDFIGSGNKDVVEAIKDYDSWADKIADCKQELAELKTTIRQLELEKFNNIVEDFTNAFDLREDGKDLISKQIDLLKEAGELIGESFFTSQIEQSQKQLALLEEEKAQLVNQMSSAISSGRVKCCPIPQ